MDKDLVTHVRTRSKLRRAAVVVVLSLPFAHDTAGQTQTATAPATRPASPDALPPGLPWHDKLQAALDEAQRTKQPILVEVGAGWCGWCRRLDVEIRNPVVQQKLAGWVRVRLDLDKDTDAVRPLAVGPVPALRVLTPLGRTVAARDGFMKADDLAAWLDAQRPKASVAAEALAGEPTDAASADALVARIADPDPVVREAATRRLLRHSSLAAARVVETFAVSGELAERLAAMELLQDWEAPLDAMDPWEMATYTEPRVAALREWAVAQVRSRPTTGPATGPTTKAAEALADAALVAARRDLATLVNASTEAESRAARERLARLGPALLTEVYAAIKAAANDRDRERLVALRYRLVASDALVIGWPGGFDRLAATDAGPRHAAVEELASRITPADAPLLLELFADPDPFVRERSLKLLRATGGSKLSGELVRLLKDPEPNVRAAVLKQLAESPVPGMEAKVAEFAAAEKDADLVVHATRVLREAKSPAAATSLRGLLGHESWRVRAEAAEGLGKMVKSYDEHGRMTDAQKADVYADMIKLLDDPDGFVVSRSVAVLRDANLPSATVPMVRAADKRPELAIEVVKALAGSRDAVALVQLRRFCGHASPAVRAAAITGLASATSVDCAAELKAALADAEAKVREAALTAGLRLMENARPRYMGSDSPVVDLDKWLADFRSGKGRPAWAAEVLPLVEKAAASVGGSERALAAVMLVATGKDDAGLPVLQAAAAGTDVEARSAAAAALAWLPWDARLSLYKQLMQKAGRDEVSSLTSRLVTIPNPAALPVLWDAVGSPDAKVDVVNPATSWMQSALLGERHYAFDAAKDQAKVQPLLDSAKAYAESGTEVQRLTALVVLASLSADDAAKVAAKLYADPKVPEATRSDAFFVLLRTGKYEDVRPAAIAALGGPSSPVTEPRRMAAKYVAFGTESLDRLRGTIYINVSRVPRFSVGIDGSEGPSAAKVPQGVTADLLRPLLADADKEAAAAAAYLMVRLGDRAAFPAVADYWRDHQRTDRQWQSRLFELVGQLDDDALVPVLDEAFTAMLEAQNRWSASSAYSAIRPMKGPNALKLRKRMRDELGADVLR